MCQGSRAQCACSLITSGDRNICQRNVLARLKATAVRGTKVPLAKAKSYSFTISVMNSSVLGRRGDSSKTRNAFRVPFRVSTAAKKFEITKNSSHSKMYSESTERGTI